MRSGPGSSVRVESKMERKHPSLPRYITVPSPALSQWHLTGTTVVEVWINGVEIGRRTLKAWDDRDVWFFDLTQQHFRKLGVDEGDTVSVELQLADQAPPTELRRLLVRHPSARALWDSLTPAQQRLRSEHIRSAKRTQTRDRRARAAVGLAPVPP